MRFKSRSRALVGAAAAGLLGLAGLTTVAPSAGAAEPTERVEGLPTYDGGTRYDTAAEAATTAYPGGSDTVVLATGERFPDALAANGLAGDLDAPILLTQIDRLPAATEAALEDLGATTVVIIGGEAAVSADVEAALDAEYDVSRVFGADRFATAEAVAEQIGTAPDVDAGEGEGALSTVVLAYGLNFPDAVAVSPALHKQALPLLLTPTDDLNSDAAEAIDTLAPEQVIIVGGEGVVSQDIEDGLEADGINVVRLAGAQRWDTAVEIANFELDQLGFSASDTFLATGFRFPDALSGGPLASVQNGPIVLTMETALPDATETFLANHDAEIDMVWGLGGSAVIDDSTLAAAAELADEGTNQAFTVTPSEAATNDASTSGTTNEGARTYTVSGLDDTVAYDIALFPCDNVTVADDGTVTFTTTGTAPNEVATGVGTTDAGNATIEVVQGVSTGGDAHVGNGEAGVTPTNGSLTFTVDSTGFDCTQPVVFADTDDDTQLDVSAAGEPEEDFGVGGEKTWIPAEAAAGTDVDDLTVQYVDTEENFYVAGGDRYNYDEDDVFQYDTDGDTTADVAITFGQWETALSVNDVVDMNTAGGYSRTFQNTFGLDNDIPAAPTGVTASVGDFDADANDTSSDDIRVDWTASTDGLIASYTATLYDDDPNTAGCQTGTQVAQNAGITGTTTDFEELADDTYCVIVVAISQSGDTSPASEPAFVEVNVTPTDAAAPTITDARTDDAGSTLTVLDGGDTIQLTFSEDMDETDVAAWAFILTDVDGDRYQLSCAGAEVECVLGDTNTAGGEADDLLTITFTTADVGTDLDGVTDLNNGTGDDVPNFPSEIVTVSSNIDDEAGNDLDLDASADTTVDTEGALATDQDQPTALDADYSEAGANTTFGSDANDAISIDFDEVVDVDGDETIVVDTDGDASTTGDQFTVDCADADITCTGNGTTTLTLTSAGGGALGTVTVGTSTVESATNVDDAAGNPANGFPELIDA